MTCRELVEFLEAYVSAGLAGDVRARFDAHLAECPDCVAYVRTYEQTIRLGRDAFAAQDSLPGDVPEELVLGILAARRKP
jgi:anti-sigma factor RsiW